MVIGAPLAGRTPVLIAALFFDLVALHALTLFVTDKTSLSSHISQSNGSVSLPLSKPPCVLLIRVFRLD